MKNLSKNILLLGLLALVAVSCQSVDPMVTTKVATAESLTKKEQAQLQAIEKVIQERVVENNIPALSVGIIKNNQTIAYHNMGTTKRGNQQKVNENTVYQLASLSKSFTAIVTKELIAVGKIDVNASITDYLPNTLSKATLQKLAPIKVRNLLQHTAGFPRDAKYAKRPWKILDGPMVGGLSEEGLLKDLEEMELLFQPNERWEYSNLGFGIMGYILERAADIPLADLYEQYLVDKYDMEKTTMDLDKAESLGMAIPYMKWWRKKTTSPWEMGYLRAGGGLCSTVADLCKMMEQQLSVYQADQFDDPLYLMEDKVSWMSNNGYPYYGYGSMGFNKTVDSTMIHYGHGGDVDGFASTYIFFPNQKIGIVMLTSSGGSWFNHLEWAIQDILLETKPRTEIPFDESVVAQYLGTYDFGKEQTINISQKDGQLQAELPRIGLQTIGSYAPNKFFLKKYTGELIFMDNELRYVDNMGNHFVGKKVEELATH